MTAYTFAKVQPISPTGNYDAVQRETCAAIGMKPVCDHGDFCVNDGSAIFIGQDHHIAYKPHFNNAAYFPGGWNTVKNMFENTCLYTAHYNGHHQTLCLSGNTDAWAGKVLLVLCDSKGATMMHPQVVACMARRARPL